MTAAAPAPNDRRISELAKERAKRILSPEALVASAEKVLDLVAVMRPDFDKGQTLDAKLAHPVVSLPYEQVAGVRARWKKADIDLYAIIESRAEVGTWMNIVLSVASGLIRRCRDDDPKGQWVVAGYRVTLAQRKSQERRPMTPEEVARTASMVDGVNVSAISDDAIKLMLRTGDIAGPSGLGPSKYVDVVEDVVRIELAAVDVSGRHEDPAIMDLDEKGNRTRPPLWLTKQYENARRVIADHRDEIPPYIPALTREQAERAVRLRQRGVAETSLETVFRQPIDRILGDCEFYFADQKLTEAQLNSAKIMAEEGVDIDTIAAALRVSAGAVQTALKEAAAVAEPVVEAPKKGKGA